MIKFLSVLLHKAVYLNEWSILPHLGFERTYKHTPNSWTLKEIKCHKDMKSHHVFSELSHVSPSFFDLYVTFCFEFQSIHFVWSNKRKGLRTSLCVGVNKFTRHQTLALYHISTSQQIYNPAKSWNGALFNCTWNIIC